MTIVATTGDAPPTMTSAAQLFWKRYFTVYDTLNEARPYRDMIARQLALLDPGPEDVVLDAGTGSGNLAAAIAPRAGQLVGIDFCVPALELARLKAPQATFSFADLTRRLPFENAAFDHVTCSAVLHVLNRAEQRFALAELARVLRPGGRMVVTAFADGFNALSVYAETLRVHRRDEGLAATVAFGLRYSVNTARILAYVRRIQREHRRGAYAYVNEASFTDLLAGAGVTPRHMERTLAGQCLTALAVKEAAPRQ
jgi:SAM-dependent methyltransferase